MICLYALLVHAVILNGMPAVASASNCATTKAGQQIGESTKRRVFFPSGHDLWELAGEYPDGRLTRASW